MGDQSSRLRTPAILLDRDGVINYERTDYVKSIQEFKLIEGALEGISTLTKSGFPIIIISNQSVIGRGLLSDVELNRIHKHMIEEIQKAGGRVDAIYYCPHKPDDHCDCRKPNIGLFKKAEKELNIDLSESWFVGDKPSDEEAGKRAGCKMQIIESNLPNALLSASKSILIQANLKHEYDTSI